MNFDAYCDFVEQPGFEPGLPAFSPRATWLHYCSRQTRRIRAASSTRRCNVSSDEAARPRATRISRTAGTEGLSGEDGFRTHHLLRATQALYQLSYFPKARASHHAQAGGEAR